MIKFCDQSGSKMNMFASFSVSSLDNGEQKIQFKSILKRKGFAKLLCVTCKYKKTRTITTDNNKRGQNSTTGMQTQRSDVSFFFRKRSVGIIVMKYIYSL